MGVPRRRAARSGVVRPAVLARVVQYVALRSSAWALGLVMGFFWGYAVALFFIFHNAKF